MRVVLESLGRQGQIKLSIFKLLGINKMNTLQTKIFEVLTALADDYHLIVESTNNEYDLTANGLAMDCLDNLLAISEKGINFDVNMAFELTENFLGYSLEDEAPCFISSMNNRVISDSITGIFYNEKLNKCVSYA